MNSREKVLSGVIAFLVIAWGAWTLWGSVGSSYAERELQLLSLQREHRDANRTRRDSRRAAAQLDKWLAMSLPADDRQAHTVYLQWLGHGLYEVGFDEVDIKNLDTQTNRRGRRNSAYQNNAYNQLRYKVSCHGTLEQLTSFLFKFYRVDCLHKIESLSMRPVKDSDKMALDLSISALALRGVSHDDALKESSTSRLVHGDLDDYQQMIVGRKLFTAYAPSPDTPTEVAAHNGGPPRSDEAKNAYVTGIVTRPGGFQAWLHFRSTDKRHLLGAGDAVDVGDFHATVVSISPRAIVLSSDGQMLRVGLGQNLGEATVLPVEGS